MKNPRIQAAGRKGGIVTAERYGAEYMSRLSKSRRVFAGRPRIKTLAEIRFEKASALIERKELPHTLPNSVSGLLRLWKEQMKQIEVLESRISEMS